MRTIWTTLFLTMGFLHAAFAGEPGADCRVYQAGDKNTVVQRDFGQFFRKGYDFAKICGAVRGGNTYYIGHRPVKGATGVCRYRERSVLREEVGEKRLTDTYPASDGTYLWYGDGECPGVNVERDGDVYMSVDGMSDEAYLALRKFWLELQTPGRNLEQIFGKVPSGHVKDVFLSVMRADSKERQVKMLAVSYSDVADSAVSSRNEPHYMVMLGSSNAGWYIDGDITDRGFEPRELGFLVF